VAFGIMVRALTARLEPRTHEVDEIHEPESALAEVQPTS